MAMTDPIADMLTRIRNGYRAHHREVEVPWSRLKENISQLLVQEGYLEDVKKAESPTKAGEVLRIQLKFDRGARPAISGIRRVSRPGRRVYVNCKDIPPVRRGLGINLISTSKGLVVDRNAQKEGVGGELICSVW